MPQENPQEDLQENPETQKNSNNSRREKSKKLKNSGSGGQWPNILRKKDPSNDRQIKMAAGAAVVFLAVLGGWALESVLNPSSNVVAVVGQEEIQQDDWQARVEARLEQMPAEEAAQLTKEQKASQSRGVLRDMINRKLLAQYAEQNDLNIEKRVESELKEGKDEMGEADFKKMLEEDDITEAELKELMYRQILIQTVIERVYDELPPVTDEEVREEYERRAEQSDLPPFEEMEEEIRSELEEEWARELRPMTYKYLRDLIGVEVYLDQD